jgi:hypothetical protein
METIKLNQIIDALAKEQGITKYRIEKMSLNDGNFEVTPNGKLVKNRFIDVKVIPLAGSALLELPITFSVKREEDE